MIQKAELNPAILSNKLKTILDIDGLKRFQNLDKTHTTERQWPRAFVLGSIALGILAAYVYKQVHQNTGIVLGVASAVFFILTAHVTAEVPTEEYAEVQAIFDNAILALRTIWEATTDITCAQIIDKGFTIATDADEFAFRFINGDLKDSNSPYPIPQDKQPQIEAFRKVHPIIKDLSTLPIEAIIRGIGGLHGVVREKVFEVYKEAQRVEKGYVPLHTMDLQPYLNNTLKDGKVVSTPWPVLEKA